MCTFDDFFERVISKLVIDIDTARRSRVLFWGDFFEQNVFRFEASGNLRISVASLFVVASKSTYISDLILCLNASLLNLKIGAENDEAIFKVVR